MKKFLSIFALVLALSLALCAAAMAEDDHPYDLDQAMTEAELGVQGSEAVRNKIMSIGTPVVGDPDKCAEYPTVVWQWPCQDPNHSGFVHRTILEANHDYRDTLDKYGPTCTEAGKSVVVCTRCGKEKPNSERDIDALGHQYNRVNNDGNKITNIVITKMPTCHRGERGNGAGDIVCVRCGESKPLTKEDKDAFVHTQYPYVMTLKEFVEKWLPEQDHDVQEKYADVAMRWYLFKGHDWDGWVGEPAATCYKKGTLVRACKVCDQTESMPYPTDDQKLEPKYVFGYTERIDCYTVQEKLVCEFCGSKEGLDDDGNKITPHPVKDGEIRLSVSHKKDPLNKLMEQKATCEEDGFIIYGCIDEATHKTSGKNTDVDPEIDYAELDKQYFDPAHLDPETGKPAPTGYFYETLKATGHKWSAYTMIHAPNEGANKLGHWVRTCTVCGTSDPYYGMTAPDSEDPVEPAKPELDKSKLDEGIVTVKGLTDEQLKKGVYARITMRYTDANGEAAMIVNSVKVNSDGSFEMPAATMPKGWTLDFRSVIITDTAAPANKLPSAVNKLVSSTTL